jgi:hypothetical protein
MRPKSRRLFPKEIRHTTDVPLRSLPVQQKRRGVKVGNGQTDQL